MATTAATRFWAEPTKSTDVPYTDLPDKPFLIKEQPPIPMAPQPDQLDLTDMAPGEFFARSGDRQMSGRLVGAPGDRFVSATPPPSEIPASFFEIGNQEAQSREAQRRAMSIRSNPTAPENRGLVQEQRVRDLQAQADADLAKRQAFEIAKKRAGTRADPAVQALEERKLQVQDAWKKAATEDKLKYLQAKGVIDMRQLDVKGAQEVARLTQEYGLRGAELAIKLANDKELEAIKGPQKLAEIDKRMSMELAQAEKENDWQGARDINKIYNEYKQKAWLESQKPLAFGATPPVETTAQPVPVGASVAAKPATVDEVPFQRAIYKGESLEPKIEYSKAVEQMYKWDETPPMMSDGTVDHHKIERLKLRIKDLKNHLFEKPKA